MTFGVTWMMKGLDKICMDGVSTGITSMGDVWDRGLSGKVGMEKKLTVHH